MRNLILTITLCLSLLTGCISSTQPIRILLLSGNNNHEWTSTTPYIKNIYEQSGKFSVDVTEKPENMDEEMLSGYDVIVSNWNAFPKQHDLWNEDTKKAFLSFIEQGGGFVAIHAASAAHYDWPEYLKVTGGTWGSKTHHGPQSTFEVIVLNSSHPITKGMKNFKIHDELWVDLLVHEDAKILAYAHAEEYAGEPDKTEPLLLITETGERRGFYHVLGHDTAAMASPEWQLLLLRGTEWAATGKVK